LTRISAVVYFAVYTVVRQPYTGGLRLYTDPTGRERELRSGSRSLLFRDHHETRTQVSAAPPRELALHDPVVLHDLLPQHRPSDGRGDQIRYLQADEVLLLQTNGQPREPFRQPRRTHVPGAPGAQQSESQVELFVVGGVAALRYQVPLGSALLKEEQKRSIRHSSDRR